MANNTNINVLLYKVLNADLTNDYCSINLYMTVSL